LFFAGTADGIYARYEMDVMSAEKGKRLESYRTADEKLVVYDSGSPCAFVASDTAVDIEELR